MKAGAHLLVIMMFIGSSLVAFSPCQGLIRAKCSYSGAFTQNQEKYIYNIKNKRIFSIRGLIWNQHPIVITITEIRIWSAFRSLACEQDVLSGSFAICKRNKQFRIALSDNEISKYLKGSSAPEDHIKIQTYHPLNPLSSAWFIATIWSNEWIINLYQIRSIFFSYTAAINHILLMRSIKQFIPNLPGSAK